LSGVYLPRRWRLHYQPLRSLTPVAELGNSILVYWMDRWPDLTGLPDRARASSQQVEVLRRLADSVFAQQWDTRAAVYYQRYLEYRPDDASALGNLGVSLMSIGRQDGALQVFGRAVRLAPSNARVRRNYATALLETGRAGQAVRQAERLVELRPQDPAARALLRAALAEQARQ
jgi:Flp pilus assembly protein TadD